MASRRVHPGGLSGRRGSTPPLAPTRHTKPESAPKGDHCPFFALKGRDNVAQGTALGTDPRVWISPCRGTTICPAPSGRKYHFPARFPRAVPWATLSQPFGLKK